MVFDGERLLSVMIATYTYNSGCRNKTETDNFNAQPTDIENSEVALKSDVASKTFANNMSMVFSGSECLFLSADADRKTVLCSLRRHLFSHKRVTDVYVHYCGHGTIEVKFADAAKAGAWICANNERVYIEDILRICKEVATHQKQPIENVYVRADACGSDGQFHSLIEQLEQKTLDLQIYILQPSQH